MALYLPTKTGRTAWPGYRDLIDGYLRHGGMFEVSTEKESRTDGETVAGREVKKPLKALQPSGFKMVHLQGLEPWTP